MNPRVGSRPWFARPTRIALVVALAAFATVGAAVARFRYGSTLDNFEGPLRPAEWAFSAGPEFPGASGSYSRTRRAARTGRRGGEIAFDFTRGGRYVVGTYPLRFRGAVNGVRLWLRGTTGAMLAVRVKDADGQVFQREIGLAPRDWTAFDVAFRDWTESWGGRNDGILRQPVQGLGLMVVNSTPEPRGSIWFDDLTRSSEPPRYAHRRDALPPHPRLLISATDLEQARRRAESEPWAVRMLGDLRRRCEAEIHQPVRVPDRGGQCEHWYACPRHGAGLRTEGPHRHVCPVGGEVFTGSPYDEVVIAHEHKRLRKFVRDAAVLYALTGEERWAAAVRSILVGYSLHYPSYRLHDINGRPGKGGRAWAQSLDEAVWLVALLQAADLIWDRLTEGERGRFVVNVVRPAVDTVIRANRLRFHNIQCWHNAAIGLAGYLTGDRDMIAEAVDGARGYHAQLRNMVNQDGQWAEGSWGYHFYAMEPLLALAEAARNSGDDLHTPALRSMFVGPILAAMPDLSLPAFNDSGRVSLREQDIYETGLRRFGDPMLSLPLQGARPLSLRALLHGVRPLPPAPPPPRGSRVLPDAGYAILSRGAGAAAAWVCVKYGPHGGGHGHPDKNSLVAYRRGEMVLDDPGVGAHLTSLPNGWYKTTVAHNSICADETSQFPATGRLIAFRLGNGVPMSLTDAGPALGGAMFRRATYLLGEDLLAIVDLLQAAPGDPREFDIFFHPGGTWARRPPGEAAVPEQAPGYRYLRELRRGRAASSVSCAVRSGSGTLRWLTVASSGEMTCWTGTGVGRHTEDRAPVLWLRRPGSSAAFVTVITLDGSARPPGARLVPCRSAHGATMAPGTCAAARVTLGRSEWTLVANPDRVSVVADGYSGSDAITVVP